MTKKGTKKLKAEPDDEKIRRYKSNCLQNVTITNNSMPKVILNWKPYGRRRLGRHLKSLFDEVKAGLPKA